MTDIFISYARSTAEKAQRIAEALRALGYGVWRDDELPAHRAYADVIQERLKAARAVVVVWSAEAVASEWVRSEAERARNERKLVQLSVDGAELPMPFDQIQCAEMAGWSGETDHPGWKKVVGSVAELIGENGPGVGAIKAAAAPHKLSICVLPFANMSDDPQQEYFSDGISEDIITDLSKVSALFVVARNNAFTFKGKAIEVQQVARQLGVGHVLEGSVRKAGSRVRITAQLIDGATGGHLWAERWDRDLDDIFALQDEISQAIVAALKLKLLPQEKKAIGTRGTTSPEAYDLYLMARNLFETGSLDDRSMGAIVRFAERAIALDPNYALAWVTKARAQATLVRRFGGAGDDGAAAAERALELDPNLAEAHAVRASRLANEGRAEEALAEVALALRLDPDSAYANYSAGRIHYGNRRFAEAARLFDNATRLSDNDLNAAGMAVSAWMAVGDTENARRAARTSLERAERIMAHDRSSSIAMDNGVFALAVLGEGARAREWIARALLLDPDNLGMRYNFACALSNFLGDTDGALELLGDVLARDPGSDNLHAARTDPDFDPIRDDPRFQKMIAEAEARLAAG